MQTNIKRFYENTKNRIKHMLKNPNIVIFWRKNFQIHVCVKKQRWYLPFKNKILFIFFLGCFTTFAHVKINAPSAFGTPPPEDWQILTVQWNGLSSVYVDVCVTCSLAGMCMVLHWWNRTAEKWKLDCR